MNDINNDIQTTPTQRPRRTMSQPTKQALKDALKAACDLIESHGDAIAADKVTQWRSLL